MNTGKSTIYIEFSLVDGGRARRLLMRAVRSKPGSERTIWRAIAAALLAWLPLLILSTIEGTALHGNAHVPLLLDFAAYGRFLLAIPLLIAAEDNVAWQVTASIRHFLASGLVRDEDLPQFESAIKKATKEGNSLAMELTLLFLVYVWAAVDHFGAGEIDHLGFMWQGLTTEAGEQLNLAGWWFRLVSLPLLQFLILTWVWRIAVWSMFLSRTSKLRLRLNATHPDAAGGLGFLGATHGAFATVAFALGAALSTILAREIVFEKAQAQAFRIPVVAFVILCLLLFLGPLLLFAPMLYSVRRRAIYDYGALAQICSRQFDDKWVKGGELEEKSILQSPDGSSLVNVARSYQLVKGMTIVPFGKSAILQIAVAAAAPILPLAFLVMPVADVLKLLMKVVH